MASPNYAMPLMPAVILSLLVHFFLGVWLFFNPPLLASTLAHSTPETKSSPVFVQMRNIAAPETQKTKLAPKPEPKPKPKPKPEPKPEPKPKPKPKPKPEPKPEPKPKPEPEPEPKPELKKDSVQANRNSINELADKPAREVIAFSKQPAEQVITNPQYRNLPKAPRYPRKALMKRQQGTVLLRILVSAAGENLELLLHKSSGYKSLDRAAMEAVKKWQFMPARIDGQLVAAWIQVSVEFKLN